VVEGFVQLHLSGSSRISGLGQLRESSLSLVWRQILFQTLWSAQPDPGFLVQESYYRTVRLLYQEHNDKRQEYYKCWKHVDFGFRVFLVMMDSFIHSENFKYVSRQKSQRIRTP
jgi:hypothetical protein